MEEGPSNPEAQPIGTMANTSNLTTPKTWNNIETEMIIQVLSYMHSPTRPKETASKREVCKHWRNAIDEHFEYWVTVNDGKADMEYLSHLRVKNCTVISLKQELDPEVPVFRNSQSLQKLSIWGEITPTNFHRLLEHADNLKQLSLNWKAMSTAGLMEDPPGKKEVERFNQFWDELTVVEITLVSSTRAPELTDNLINMLSKSMQNLTALKMMRIGLKSPDWERFITALYSFLGRSSSRNLKTFHFNWYFGDVTIRRPRRPLQFSSANQLESLRVSLIPDLVPFWLPVIRSQRMMKDFRLIFRIDYLALYQQAPAELRQVLESTLPLNQSTLTTVELCRFNLSAGFDARIFQNMEKLTRFIFRPCQCRGNYQRLLNLSLLPGSIETLVLGRAIVQSEELKLLVERLDNIEVVEIFGTQMNGDFVLKDIFEILARKEKIRRITVNPLDELILSRVNTVSKNAKTFLLVGGHEMEVLWKGLTPSINYSFL